MASTPSPLVQIALGCVIGMAAFALPIACGAGTFAGGVRLSPEAACKLDALRVLPRDRNHLTIYDAVDIYDRVRACEREQDGGS